MSTTIRPAVHDDVTAVCELARRWEKDGETRGYMAGPQELLVQFVGQCFFIAEDDGEVVGFVFAQVKVNEGAVSAVVAEGARYLEIEDLYVVPSRRCDGLGTRLVDAVAGWAKQHEIQYLLAYSSTRAVERILHFYEACGFEPWSVQMFRDLE